MTINSSLQLTGELLAGTLAACAARPATLADVHAWGRANDLYPRFLWAANAVWSLKPEQTIDAAKAFLREKLDTEEGKRKRGHWSFDANRFIATRQMLAHIEAYEAVRGGAK